MSDELTDDARSEFRGRPLLVLIGCTLSLSVNFASLLGGSFTTFIKPISETTGWSRSQITTGHALATLAVLLLIPWIGVLADRIGARRIILLGVPAFSLAFAAIGWVSTSYPVYLGVMLAVGVAGAASYSALYFALLPHWFNRRLGLAVGIASSGVGLGLMAGPVISQRLIGAFGWQTATLMLGALACSVAWPCALWLLRDGKLAPAVASSGRQGPMRFLGNPRFWQIAGAYFLAGLAINGVVIHIAPLMTDRGISAEDAALMAGYLGGSVLVARIVTGAVLDIFDAGRVGAMGFLLAAIGIGLLAQPTHPQFLLPAILLIGAALGAETCTLSYVTRCTFGLERYGSVVGSIMSAFLTGCMIGPLFSSLAFDLTGNYVIALYAFCGIVLCAAALHFTVTRPTRVQ